jgi:hypothetical protein
VPDIVYIPGKRPVPKVSNCLPNQYETELRRFVLDADDMLPSVGAKTPQIIIGNDKSGCHVVYFHGPDGTKFVFHYHKMQYAITCKCIV